MTKEKQEKELKNRINAVGQKKNFELKHRLRPGNQTIGNYYQYDHKITSLIGTLLISLAVITQQSVFSYIYAVGSYIVLKDTLKTGFTGEGFRFSSIKAKPLVYYVLAASIIYVAAVTSNHFIPVIEGGITYYGGQVLP